eukprot:8225638-Pyramimonas_sp.AAC.1
MARTRQRAAHIDHPARSHRARIGSIRGRAIQKALAGWSLRACSDGAVHFARRAVSGGVGRLLESD